MKLKRKEQKGITLVALVITIVVLLILSGIVINQMQQSGIIGKAQNAKEMQEEARVDEETKLNSYVNTIKEHSGGDGDTQPIENMSIAVEKGTYDAETDTIELRITPTTSARGETSKTLKIDGTAATEGVTWEGNIAVYRVSQNKTYQIELEIDGQVGKTTATVEELCNRKY